jgi:UTP--glucose-1-phosphate uridylyltransferase
VNLQAGDSVKQTVRKAVIAAAGYGTRFLPQTKAMPKEMLPVVDKPIIQIIVEELVDAGIEDIVIITGYHKRSLEDHFDVISAGLGANLREAGKTELLDQMKKISNLANFAYIRQKGPYGNATPLLNAEHFIRDEPFIYTWGDDFVLSQPSRFRQIVETYNQTNGSVLTCIPAKSDDDYKRYAFIDGREAGPGLREVSDIIEKPGSKEASPSNIASVGGYLFRPEIFDYLKSAKEKLSPGEEFIFQPSIQDMIRDGHKIYGRVIDGKFYDTGNKLEYLKTVVDFALMHDELKDDFREYLRNID